MGRILVAGEPGNQIVAELAPLDGEIVIDKPGKGMFWATGLHETLQRRGITHLVFAGVTTEVCVQTSMREANDRGYECLLIEDATESYFPQFKAGAIEMIVAQGGIVGWVTPLAALEDGIRGGDGAWLSSRDARSETIRAIGTPSVCSRCTMPYRMTARRVGRLTMQIDDPETLAEISAVFDAYEKALLENDAATLDAMFLHLARPCATAWPRCSTASTRFGVSRRAETVRPDAVAHGDHHLRPRHRSRLDAVSPTGFPGPGRSADADLDPDAGGLEVSPPRMSA